MQITAYLIGRVKIRSSKIDIAIRCPCFHMIYLENDKFATFIKIYDLSFELKLKYFKCSEAVFSEKSHAIFFVWFDSLHPINNLSVIKGWVFLG